MSNDYQELIIHIWKSGDKYYYNKNMQLHRENGPAIEYADGTKFWYLNGKLHREDGPAIEYTDGDKSWYLHGEKLTEQEFLMRTTTYNGKIVEIDGKKYKLTNIVK